MSVIKLLQGDITKLNVDGIVNAANRALAGGGGVDGCIHRAAGPGLLAECKTLGGCRTGEVKATKAYRLERYKAILHTVGPIIRDDEPTEKQQEQLHNCYYNSLELAKDLKLKSIAFPCISTGVYSFPSKLACDIAVQAVKNWFNANPSYNLAVIFCTFNPNDTMYYMEKGIEKDDSYSL